MVWSRKKETMNSNRRQYLNDRKLLIKPIELFLSPTKFLLLIQLGYGDEYWAVDTSEFHFENPPPNICSIRDGKCLDVDDLNCSLQEFADVIGAKFVFGGCDWHPPMQPPPRA